MPTAYRKNHYVPQWYQKGFLPDSGEMKFHLLDLKPDFLNTGDGKKIRRKAVRRLGAENCFFEYDLYSTKFGQLISTDIEKFFFGEIDSKSVEPLNFVSSFNHPEWIGEHFTQFLNFMSVQKLRTPKGLRQFGNLMGIENSNHLLLQIQRLQSLYCATWTECIWQIASAENSDVKFIMSDHPVTVYNRKCYPGSQLCSETTDPDIRMNGTHTIYPLNKNKILILTNLSWVRDPFGNPLRIRPNPVFMRNSFFDMRSVQIERTLSETEVLEFNHIIKSRAVRYIASENPLWLYPEKSLSSLGWFMLGNGDLCMPDPRSSGFGSQATIGYESGHVESFDEYGLRPGQRNFSNEQRRQAEYSSYERAKGEFAYKHGKRRRGRAFQFDSLDPEEDSDDMHQFHLTLRRRNR